MNGFNVVFTKSTNHGTDRLVDAGSTYGNVSWNDKPMPPSTATSARTSTHSFDGPTGGDTYARSERLRATWSRTE